MEQIKTLLRQYLLWESFERRPSQILTFRQLKVLVDSNIADEDDGIGYAALRDLIGRMKQHPQRPGIDLHLHGPSDSLDPDKRSVEIVPNSEYRIFAERRAFPELKRNLGALLWNYLLTVPLPAGVKRIDPPSLSPDFYRKVVALQRKSTLGISVDAGSTTESAIAQLLSVKDIPIRVAPTADQDAKSQPEGAADLAEFRFIVPTITTNSPSIATMVLDSPHRRNVQTRLIGGELDLDRRSICGPLSELALRQWNTRADLALIGATSFIPAGATTATASDPHPGYAGFACDNVSEAWLKSTLLQQAWFRVLILDSRKLLQQKGTSMFAPLGSSVFDLVVIDDGVEIDAILKTGHNPATSTQTAVRKFCAAAEEAKVPVLRLKTEAPRSLPAA